MSHFSVAVFTDGTKTVEELLAPYDENAEVSVYVHETKDQIIKRVRDEIRLYAEEGPYFEWKNDCEKYEKTYNHQGHLDYLRFEFPKRLCWTDEECYQNEIKFYEEDDLDENGSILSTYNPDSKWDWYSVGGRFHSKIVATKGLHGEIGRHCQEGKYDIARVKDISFQDDFFTFAVVLPDGMWYEKGTMGWWAIVTDEKKDWNEKYKERFLDTADPDWVLTIVDCHI